MNNPPYPLETSPWERNRISGYFPRGILKSYLFAFFLKHK